jgi:3,4-dihydroxy-2-butanone 4-phosphate synthase
MLLADFASVGDALAALGHGDPIILIDDERGTADLVLAAARISAAAINLQATHACGLTELALSPARIERLRLPPMASGWDAPRKPFAISIEARTGVSTGISAYDRAATIRAAVAPGAQADDLISPGHVFPLRTRPGDLIDVIGQGPARAEAALALADLAGCGEGAVLSEILDDQGDLARGATLTALGRRLDLVRTSIAQIAAYQAAHKSHLPASPGRPVLSWSERHVG